MSCLIAFLCYLFRTESNFLHENIYFSKQQKTAEIKFDFKRAKNHSTRLNIIFC
jgi:hypothetical protein